MDEIKRSYAKASTKSKVYSVRWDNEKLSFLQSRNNELKTGQQIADYLLNKFWWDNKMPHVTAKEAPPLELKTTSPITIGITTLPAKTYEQFKQAKRECETPEDWEKLQQEILASQLSKLQKDTIIKYN